ncbi:GntR family transcriptional regulator [Bacillaceae bacterium W0354]
MLAKLKDDQPIFQQIAELIETNILEGSIEIGERVPSTNEIAKFYQINPATAAKGINLLVDEGILFKKRGIGMFVANEAREIILQKRKKQFKNDFVLPMIQEARRIQMDTEQLIEMLREGIRDED